MRAALGEPHPAGTKLLTYRVRSGREAWTWEIAVSATSYAERRTRADGARHTLGVTRELPWLRTAENRPAVEIEGELGAEARTRHALFHARFARPSPRDSVEMLPAGASAWELSYRPEGGQTLGLKIDRLTSLPTSFDWVDAYHRIQVCEDLAPGDSYAALTKLGVEVEDRGGRPVVTRIVPGSRAASLRFLHEDDPVMAIDGRATPTADSVTAAIARADAPTMRLVWSAGGVPRTGTVSMR